MNMNNAAAYNDITIRNAASNDLPGVYRLICELENEPFNYELFERIFEANLKRTDCFYYVATSGNNIVGFISFHIQYLLHHCGAVGEIQEFYVDQSFRGKGVGRLLMNEVKKAAVINKVTSLEVTSNKKRVENVAVYESLGFKLTHNKFTI